MKQNLIFKSIQVFISYFLCSFTILQAQDIPKEIENELNKTGEKMVQATLDGDYLALIDFYSDDAVIMPDFKPPIRGKKALKDQFREDEKLGVEYHSFTGTVEKRWRRGDEIYERGSFGMAVSSRDSRRPTAFYGSYFQIWQKQKDGSFKISFTIWNLDFNPFESY